MSLARALWKENSDVAAATLAHPFVRGIADGSLPRDAFTAYVAQDAFFLDGFAHAYTLAQAHSPDQATRDTFAGLLAGVRDELRLHAAYAETLGLDLERVVPSPTTRAYLDFLLAPASRGAVGLTCAAMTPCMRLYAHLGQSLAGGVAEQYADWVLAYADPAFEQLAVTLEQLLDAHATDSRETHFIYRRAMQLEVAFFDEPLAARRPGVSTLEST